MRQWIDELDELTGLQEVVSKLRVKPGEAASKTTAFTSGAKTTHAKSIEKTVGPASRAKKGPNAFKRALDKVKSKFLPGKHKASDTEKQAEKLHPAMKHFGGLVHADQIRSRARKGLNAKPGVHGELALKKGFKSASAEARSHIKALKKFKAKDPEAYAKAKSALHRPAAPKPQPPSLKDSPHYKAQKAKEAEAKAHKEREAAKPKPPPLAPALAKQRAEKAHKDAAQKHAKGKEIENRMKQYPASHPKQSVFKKYFHKVTGKHYEPPIGKFSASKARHAEPEKKKKPARSQQTGDLPRKRSSDPERYRETGDIHR